MSRLLIVTMLVLVAAGLQADSLPLTRSQVWRRLSDALGTASEGPLANATLTDLATETERLYKELCDVRKGPSASTPEKEMKTEARTVCGEAAATKLNTEKLPGNKTRESVGAENKKQEYKEKIESIKRQVKKLKKQMKEKEMKMDKLDGAPAPCVTGTTTEKPTKEPAEEKKVKRAAPLIKVDEKTERAQVKVAKVNPVVKVTKAAPAVETGKVAEPVEEKAEKVTPVAKKIGKIVEKETERVVPAVKQPGKVTKPIMKIEEKTIIKVSPAVKGIEKERKAEKATPAKRTTEPAPRPGKEERKLVASVVNEIKLEKGVKR